LVLTQARVEAASGRVNAALASARFALAQARRFGLGVTELDARLVVLQIELAASSADQARARLEALEREAASKGLGLIVRKIRAQVAAEQWVRGAINVRETAVKVLV
jgi:hypothetical protein